MNKNYMKIANHLAKYECFLDTCDARIEEIDNSVIDRILNLFPFRDMEFYTTLNGERYVVNLFEIGDMNSKMYHLGVFLLQEWKTYMDFGY